MRALWIGTLLPALCLVIISAGTLCAEPCRYHHPGRSCLSCHTDSAGGRGLTPEGRAYVRYRNDDPSPLVPSRRSPVHVANTHDIATDVPSDDSGGGTAGMLAVGFGLISLCLLAYRRRG